MDNGLGLRFGNKYKIFATMRFQLKLVKSFPIIALLLSTDWHTTSPGSPWSWIHGTLLWGRVHRTELWKWYIGQRYNRVTLTSIHFIKKWLNFNNFETCSHHISTREIARWQRRPPWPEACEVLISTTQPTAKCKQRSHSCFTSLKPYKYLPVVDYKPLPA